MADRYYPFGHLQDNDPLLGQSPWKSTLTTSEGETLGGFPVNFLVQVVSFSRKKIMHFLLSSDFYHIEFCIILSPSKYIFPPDTVIKDSDG